MSPHPPRVTLRRDERGSRGLSLVQKGYLLWIKKEF
jgi:hypothetical protein